MELVFVVVESELDHYVNLFLRIKRASRRPRTVEWYENVLRYYKDATCHLHPDWPPTTEHCLAFLEVFEAKNLAEYSRNNYYRAVNAFFNWACGCGFIRDNPFRYIDTPVAPRPLPKAPPQVAAARLIATVCRAADENERRWQNVRDLALLSLALDTGARVGELATILIGDLDLVNQEIVIYGQKNHKGRTLEFGDDAAADLMRWLEKRAELQPPRRLYHLFISNYRGQGFRHLTPSGMRQRLSVWLERAAVDHFTFHSLRHAYAVYSLRNRADLLDIKEQMGHSSIRTTAIYTEVVDEGRKERHRRTSPRGNLPLDEI